MNFISNIFSLIKKDEPLSEKDSLSDFIVTNENILDFFARYFHIEKDLLVAHNRKKEIVEIRDIIIYILRKYGGFSFPVISKILGGRDHTTIIHSYNKKKTINIENDYKDLILKIIEFRDSEKRESLVLELQKTEAENSDINKKILKQKEIPSRNIDILNLFRYDFSLREIGERFGITRERARQIIKDTIYKIEYNESIIENRKIRNVDDLLNDEKHKITLKFSPSANLEKKEISSRDSDILTLSEYGFSLEDIGKRYDISEKEIEQIIQDTKDRIDFNKSISNQKSFKNTNSIYRKEKQKREIKKRNPTQKTIKEKREKKWGMYIYDQCKICNTTEFPHSKEGLCERCNGAFRGDRREKIISSHNSRCDVCGISRDNSKIDYGRDFYISKNMEVFCRKCHLTKTGKILSASKKNKWKMFYKNA